MLLKKIKKLAAFTLVCLLVGNIITTVSAAAGKQVSVILNGKSMIQDVSPIWQGERVLVSLSGLKEGLGVTAIWDSATKTVTMSSTKGTLKLVPGSKKMWKEGKELSLDVAPKVVKGRIMVPARVLESLGITVGWNGETNTIDLSYPLQVVVPNRTMADTFPARVAFTNNDHLWLLDGEQSAEPIQVTETGYVQILDWSHDGKWLAYLYTKKNNFYGDNAFLWVVDNENTRSYQIDSQPVFGQPSWSPTSNTLVYATDVAGSQHCSVDLKMAQIGDEKADVTELLKSNPVCDWIWSPAGDSFIISVARTEENPLNIEQLTLKGERTVLYELAGRIGEKEKQEGIYSWGAEGLRLSPNGFYLAYFLRPNSGSISADGVGIQLLDLKEKGKPQSIGGGLINREWLAWSPDSAKLAFIEGSGREATVNKRLAILDVKTGEITDGGKNGYVDTWPVWVNGHSQEILFLRGKENTEWLGKKQAGVLVPGEEIWVSSASDEAKALTRGTLVTAHRTPQVSADGKYLTYLSLNSMSQGSLVLKFLAGGKEVEVLRGITGDPGYYGNYYPGWVSVYFK